MALGDQKLKRAKALPNGKVTLYYENGSKKEIGVWPYLKEVKVNICKISN